MDVAGFGFWEGASVSLGVWPLGGLLCLVDGPTVYGQHKPVLVGYKMKRTLRTMVVVYGGGVVVVVVGRGDVVVAVGVS